MPTKHKRDASPVRSPSVFVQLLHLPEFLDCIKRVLDVRDWFALRLTCKRLLREEKFRRRPGCAWSAYYSAIFYGPLRFHREIKDGYEKSFGFVGAGRFDVYAVVEADADSPGRRCVEKDWQRFQSVGHFLYLLEAKPENLPSIEPWKTIELSAGYYTPEDFQVFDRRSRWPQPGD